MTDPADIVSDVSDLSDAVEATRQFQSDAPAIVSDVSDPPRDATTPRPTRPTADGECRTGKSKGKQGGPTCPTRPTKKRPDWAALVALFSKPGGEATAGDNVLDGSAPMDTPNKAPAHAGAPDLEAFEERAAVAEHDGGLTRDAAEQLAAEEQGFATAAEFRAAVAGVRSQPSRAKENLSDCETVAEAKPPADVASDSFDVRRPDADRLAEALESLGPMTQGAAAAALGWGASRAWQAEAALRKRGLILYDNAGRARLVASDRPEEPQKDRIFGP